VFHWMKNHKYICSIVLSFLLLFIFSCFSLKESLETEKKYRSNFYQYQKICVSSDSKIPSDLCELFLEGSYETSFEDVLKQTITFQDSIFYYLLSFFVWIPVCVCFYEKKKFSRSVLFSMILLPFVFSFLTIGVYFMVKDFSDVSSFSSMFLGGFFLNLVRSFLCLGLGYLSFFKIKHFGLSFLLFFFVEGICSFFGLFSIF